MRSKLHIIFLCALLVVSCQSHERVGPGDVALNDGGRVRASVSAVLEHADQFTIYSLEPTPVRVGQGQPEPDPADVFHNYRILGQAVLAEQQERGELLAMIYDSVRRGDQLTVAGCFNPRHGIRAEKDEQVVELVICFQCIAIRVYESGVDRTNLPAMSDSAGDVNAFFKARGLEIAH